MNAERKTLVLPHTSYQSLRRENERLDLRARAQSVPSKAQRKPPRVFGSDRTCIVETMSKTSVAPAPNYYNVQTRPSLNPYVKFRALKTNSIATDPFKTLWSCFQAGQGLKQDDGLKGTMDAKRAAGAVSERGQRHVH